MVEYKIFLIRSGSEPLSETLLGRATQWYPTGTIFYVRPNQSVVELTRFRLSGIRFDDQRVAEWFGLELARLVIDSCYREWSSKDTKTRSGAYSKPAAIGDSLKGQARQERHPGRGGATIRETVKDFLWRRAILKKHRTCLPVRLSAFGTLSLFFGIVGCYTTDPGLEAILRDAKRKQQAIRQNTLSPSTPSSGGTDAPAGRSVPVHLSWSDNSDNESNFVIERCDQVQLASSAGTATCTGTWRTIATVSADSTEHTDKTASTNQTYIYRVKAINSRGSSGYTETVITTPAQ